jgi:hypothetical protein
MNRTRVDYDDVEEIYREWREGLPESFKYLEVDPLAKIHDIINTGTRWERGP